MRNLATEQIRKLLLQAVDYSQNAGLPILGFTLKVCILMLEEIGRNDSPQRSLMRIPGDRPPEVVGIWEWDIVNKLVYADPDVARIYNVDPNHAQCGIPEHDFGGAIHSEDMSRVTEAISYTLRQGSSFNCLYRLVQADGSLRTVFVIGRAIFENGSAINFKGTVIDVTRDEVRRQRVMQFRLQEGSIC